MQLHLLKCVRITSQYVSSGQLYTSAEYCGVIRNNINKNPEIFQLRALIETFYMTARSVNYEIIEIRKFEAKNYANGGR